MINRGRELLYNIDPFSPSGTDLLISGWEKVTSGRTVKGDDNRHDRFPGHGSPTQQKMCQIRKPQHQSHFTARSNSDQASWNKLCKVANLDQESYTRCWQRIDAQIHISSFLQFRCLRKCISCWENALVAGFAWVSDMPAASIPGDFTLDMAITTSR